MDDVEVDHEKVGAAEDDPQMVNLTIPVVVKVRGMAKIKVRLTASAEEIRDAASDVQFGDLEDVDMFESMSLDDDAWVPEFPKHLLSALPMVGSALSKLDALNIAVVACEYSSTNSVGRASEMLDQNPRYMGFAYIHEQNVDDLGSSGKCQIGFSHRDDDPDKSIFIGKLVRQAFLDGNFRVEWDETHDTKLSIESNLRRR